jgi:serine phosphatase RsbU (regulator of sigma subunit)
MSQELRHLDELAELPEKEAVRTYLDRNNHGVLFVLLRFAAFFAVVALIPAADDPSLTALLVPLLSLVLIALMFLWRRRPDLDQRFAHLGFLYLFVQLVLLRFGYLGDATDGFTHPIDFTVPWVLLAFRLTVPQLTACLGIFWLPIMVQAIFLGPMQGHDPEFGMVFGYSVFLSLIFGLSRFLTWRRTKSFSAAWLRASERAREQRRMREELDQARRIQLSMLPQVEPHNAWLEVAGASLPATEVGGDYYDYFAIAADRQAIVVADVAGHGVASGLVLAGVRGCLVMLHEDEHPPIEILRRLDRVVRTIGGRRSLVAMIYAVFDQGSRQLRWSSAGISPILRYRAADGGVEELAEESLPLGPSLARRFHERQTSFDAGDVFVFLSDGASETVDADGWAFGDDRLQDALRRLAPGATAGEVRDGLLAELVVYRGDVEQKDDVTLVVARVK